MRRTSLSAYCREHGMEHLLAEWDGEKNGGLTPDNVAAKSNRRAWWKKAYDDPNTGRHFVFRWKTTVENRVNGGKCPYLSGHMVMEGFNDLATLRPELAEEWDYDRNGGLKPTDVTVNSAKKVWWKLPYDDPATGKHFVFVWQAAVCNRTRGRGCPYLSGQAVLAGFNDLATTHPGLALEWNYEKNGSLKPTDITAGCNKIVWWKLPYDDPKTGRHFDFEWQAKVLSRANGARCPYIFSRNGRKIV